MTRTACFHVEKTKSTRFDSKLFLFFLVSEGVMNNRGRFLYEMPPGKLKPLSTIVVDSGIQEGHDKTGLLSL